MRLQVGKRDLPQAIALNSVAYNLARSVGPALGGLLLTLSGAGLAFAINAASYVALIGVLAWWRPEVAPRTPEPMLVAIGKGLAFCRQSGPIRRVLLRGLAFGFGAAGYQALIPALARDQLHSGELGFGLLLGSFGIGSILSALFGSRLRRRWGSEAAMTGASAGFVAAQFVLAGTTAMPLALAATFVAGASWVLAMTSLNVAMQLRSPENILGRYLSIYQAVTFGGMAAWRRGRWSGDWLPIWSACPARCDWRGCGWWRPWPCCTSWHPCPRARKAAYCKAAKMIGAT